MPMNNDNIELACHGLRRAVQCWCRRYTNIPKDKSLPPDIDQLLNHTAHLARQLNSKQKTLQTGLSFLQKTLWPQTLEFFRQASDSVRAQLLQHFLVQCLRLHDGVLLLISGECRHVGDIRQAKKSPFPSQLSFQSHRPDGYTKLYNAPGGYSGFGVDEWNDPQIGIQIRLSQSMMKYAKKNKTSEQKISEFLVEHGGQAFESWLDQHESQMTAIHQEFLGLRDQVVRNLKQVIGQNKGAMSGNIENVNVAFVLHDKMEKLQVGNILLERRGNAFQVLDSKGTLPSGYTLKDWERVMKLPESLSAKTKEKSPSICQNRISNVAEQEQKNRKRRRVIEESSSEDEVKTEAKESKKSKKKPNDELGRRLCKQTPAKTASVGLSVKIKSDPKPQTPGDGKSYSLTSIKSQMGADFKALESAREELEKEEAEAAKAAKVDEIEDENMTTSIEQGETKVRRAIRVLRRSVLRNSPDESEIWDARECLREACMAVGNQILWKSSSPSDQDGSTDDRPYSLQKAYSYFEQAKELVKDQETFHRALSSQGKSISSPEESRFFLRNLLLLRGQAQTNLGITRIEQASHCKKVHNIVDSKHYLCDAVQELSTAKDCAEALRSRALLDLKRGSNIVETTVDSLRADQLDSLASRWKATAMWHQKLRDESVELFEYGASFFLNGYQDWKENDTHDGSILEVQLQLASECFYACTAFADVASSSMEELPTEAVQEGNELLAYVEKGLEKACRISEAIQGLIHSHPSDNVNCEEFLEDNEIMISAVIRQSLKDLKSWWDRRKEIATRPIRMDLILQEKRPATPFRSDLVPDALENLPKRRFVINKVSSRPGRKRKKGLPNSMYHQNSGNLTSAIPNTSDSGNVAAFADSQPEKKYRPWGDELLPQIIDPTTGRSVPKIVYPAIAPPMPPDVRAILYPDKTD